MHFCSIFTPYRQGRLSSRTYSTVDSLLESKEFENGKNQNKLRPQDIEHIVSTYRKFAARKLQAGVVEDKYAYVATLQEIADNDFNLNIPRYVDTFEEEEEIDIKAVQTEIDTLETELKEVQAKMKEYLTELGY